MTARWIAITISLAAACGGGGGTPDAGSAPVDGVVADAPPPGEPWFDEGLHRGRIEIDELAGLSAGNAQAQALFTPQPTRMRFVFYARVAVLHWQQETQRAGSCRLLQLVPAFCAMCAGICVAPDVCEPYPEYASAGALTFAGLVGAPVTLQPNPYFYASQGELPADAFADAATITASATGDVVPAFSLAAGGVPPLVAEVANDELHLADGADATVTWTPVDPADPTLRVRVTLNANNAGHGLPYEAVLECDAADVGAVTIPAAMIDAFPTTEAWGACAGSDCPVSTITRYRKTSADVGGAPVDLVVGSQRAFWVVHP